MMSFNNGSISIWIDEQQVLHFVWESFATSKQYREGWTKALTLANEKKINKWLIDQRESGTIMPKDLRWANEEWYPKATKLLGEQSKIAVLPPKSAFGELSVRKAIEQLEAKRKEPLKLKYFSDNSEAVEWLFV
ncbi:MAG: hypothetical protein ACFB0B_02865 [Thermonemataceae bacterium]